MFRNPLFILAVLTGLNLFNYLDRMVVAAVLKPMSDELHLSGLEGGLLSTVFLLGYFLTSPLFGWAGDRGSRPRLIALGVIIWSLATIASGVARDLHSLIAARVLVGVGEASYATIAPTIIDDISPKEKKGRWLAIFFTAAPVGSALGYVFGGTISHTHGWRTAFFVAGAPGVLLALAALFLVDPPRKAAGPKVSIVAAARDVVRLPTFLFPALGYAAFTFALVGLGYWAPAYLGVTYGVDEKKASLPFGIATVIAGTLGSLLGGFLGDRAKTAAKPDDPANEIKRNEVRAYLRVCAIATVVALPPLLFAFYASTLNGFIAWACLAQLALFAATSPINAATLRGVPEERRASAMALLIFVIHVFGDLWSPPLVGLVKDASSMAHGMMLLPAGFALAAVLWGFGAVRIREYRP